LAFCPKATVFPRRDRRRIPHVLRQALWQRKSEAKRRAASLLTADCIDTDSPTGRGYSGHLGKPLIEIAHVHHATWVMLTETRCEGGCSGEQGEIPGIDLQPRDETETRNREGAHQRAAAFVPKRAYPGVGPKGPARVARAREKYLPRSRRGHWGIILCSHLLSEIEEVCDGVIILRSGEIVASGTVVEVMRKTRHNNVQIRIPERSVARAKEALGGIPGVLRISQGRTKHSAGWTSNSKRCPSRTDWRKRACETSCWRP
jgi:hypothetical protein